MAMPIIHARTMKTKVLEILDQWRAALQSAKLQGAWRALDDVRDQIYALDKAKPGKRKR